MTIGLALVVAAGAAAALAAASLRLRSLVSTLLVAYVGFTANLGAVTLALSPFHEVDRGGLAVAEGLLLAAAFGCWALRGRPGLPLEDARAAVVEVVSSPVTLAFLVAVVALVGYELALGLTVPPNNWDSLTYHLARVASWAHHGGLYWIPNAPTDRMNEFQPVAEQQILFLFVATGSDRLYAVPQLLAELSILVAVYGAARRLGYEVRAAACSAFLLATFTVVALEASTAQNDLVAAALPVAAACLLLGGARVELAAAGAAAGIGIGVKLTTGIVWPLLAWLALLRGRRPFLIAAMGTFAGLAVVGCWGYVLNLVHTGHLLGHGGGRSEHTVSPSYPGSLVTGLSVLYMAMDLSSLWPLPIALLTAAGLAVGLAVALYLRGRGGLRPALAEASGVALPFLAPAAVLAGGAVLAFATRRLGAPMKGPGGAFSSETSFFGGLNNIADENQSDFGPIGAVVLLGVPLATIGGYLLRRARGGGGEEPQNARRASDVRPLVLALALPAFLLVLSLWSQFNVWLGRFLIVPVALAAPLLARLFRSRLTMAAYLTVGVLVAGLAVTRDTTKSLESALGAPWSLTRVEALDAAAQPAAARGLAALDRALPADACVGALLGQDDPAYLVGGPSFARRVTYLPHVGAVASAESAGLEYVVIAGDGARAPAHVAQARAFAARGWLVRPLGGYWSLASHPRARAAGRAGSARREAPDCSNALDGSGPRS